MSSSSLPVCQNLTEHFNSVLVDIKFQQIWKLQFRYLNCIRLENPELFQVSRPKMEFSGWTDVDVECPQVWKIRQEDVNHVLRIIIVHYPLIQLNVGRKMNGKRAKVGELGQNLGKLEGSLSARQVDIELNPSKFLAIYCNKIRGAALPSQSLARFVPDKVHCLQIMMGHLAFS